MPELPEVETVKRGLKRLIVGRVVKSVENRDSPKSFPNSSIDVENFLLGARITDVRRRAKVLMIDFDTNYTLVVHLKMTGQLVYIGNERWGGGHPNDSFINSLPDRFTREIIVFDDNSCLYFNDMRKFGWMKLIPTAEVENMEFIKKIGPEPFDETFTADDFIKRIRRRNNTTMKSAILDQTTIAGVGNIYADESLWMTSIHPATRVRDVSDEEIAKLLQNIKNVMKTSIEKGGSTDRNYVDAEGNKGSYLKFAKVFRREGQKCFRHEDNFIEKIRVAGRGTHICSVCQTVRSRE